MKSQMRTGASLKFLIRGFVLAKQQEGKSPRTVEDYAENLKRFLWYAEREGWSDNAREISQWHIREFLGYVANEVNRWESDTLPAQRGASKSTVHHYYRVLRCFFNWIVAEGFLRQSPVAKVKFIHRGEWLPKMSLRNVCHNSEADSPSLCILVSSVYQWDYCGLNPETGTSFQVKVPSQQLVKPRTTPQWIGHKSLPHQ